MTATAGYVRTERENLIAKLTTACQSMTTQELLYLLTVAHGLNEIQTPQDGAP